MKIETVPIDKLIPYARNSRTHSDEQIAQVAASIREFGFTNPVLIDAEDGIIAGHGRVMAGRKLGLKEVPCIRLAHLTEAQKRAYIIADNKLALNSGWDEELLAVELADLREMDFDLNLTGFDGDEIELFLNPPEPDSGDSGSDLYTQKVDAPTYEAKGEKPPVSDLFDRVKYDTLLSSINSSAAPEDVKSFLRLAASRHIVFDYGNIAEFYCHAEKGIQLLMEESALIVIDFKEAIAKGYVNLTKRLQSQFEDTVSDPSDQ